MHHNASPSKNQRPIRSYVLRQGRMTPAQTKALEGCWKIYGIDLTQHPINMNELFSRAAPIILEIGFGMGQSLLEQSTQFADYNFIGIEVHRPGIGSLLAQLHKHHITNVRVFAADAIDVLQQTIPDQSLTKVQIFFPDPWPKSRHHKRRLIQSTLIDLIAQKLKPSGQLHIATDWQDYAEQVLALLNASLLFCNEAPDKQYVLRPLDRPLTKFETRGKKLGHGVWDILFRRR